MRLFTAFILLIGFNITAIAQIVKTNSISSEHQVQKGLDSLKVSNKNSINTKQSNNIKQLLNEDDPEFLEELVLSVSKNKENISRVAEQMNILNQKQIKNLNPQTTADVFNQIPGLFVQKSQMGGGSPVLRGMEANRVLLVVDGVRMNNAIYRKGHLQNSLSISPFSLDRVEVVFGPSSMVYGSDALGGVIHYYTKMLSFTDQTALNANAYTGFNSVNTSSTYLTDFSLRSKQWTYYGFVSKSFFGDLRMGKNRNHGYENWGKVNQYFEEPKNHYFKNSTLNRNSHIHKNTGYNQTDIIQKIGYKFKSNLKALLNIQYSTSSNIPRFDRMQELKDDDLKFIEWYYGPQKRFLSALTLRLNDYSKWMDYGTLTFSYQNIEESRIIRQLSNPLERNRQMEQVQVYSINGDFYVNLAKKQKRKLHYGFEWSGNRVDSKSINENLTYDNLNNNLLNTIGFSESRSRYPSDYSNYFTSALYLNYRQSLDLKNTLNTGLRFSHTLLSAKWLSGPSNPFNIDPVKVDNAALTASFSLTHKPKKYSKWGFVLSSGFRSPNIDDIGKVREKNGYLTVPNTNLKPEYAYNSEVNYTYNKSKKIGYTFNMYYSLLDNYITRSDWNGESGASVSQGYTSYYLQTNVNKGKAYITGSTFQFWTPKQKQLQLNGNISYTTGYSLDTNEPLSSIPPLNGSFLLNLKQKKYNVQLAYQFQAAKKSNKYNTTEGIDNLEQSPLIDETESLLRDRYAGTPFWATWNLQSQINLNKKMQLQLGIENILDTHYKVFASAISGPGRNFKASLHYTIL